MNWIATDPCGACDGEGVVAGIGGRLTECGNCLGNGGTSQWVATEDGPLIIMVNRSEDLQWRCKLMFGARVSRSAQFVGRWYAIPATGGGVAYLDPAWDDLPSAQRGAELAVGLMLTRAGEGAAV